MTNFKDAKERFTYIWEVKNLAYCAQQTGKYIKSPHFCVPQFKNTKWYLKLYPLGFKEEFKDYISCYLFRGEDYGPKTVEVHYKISMSSKQIIFSSKKDFKEYKGSGCATFLSHNSKDYRFYKKYLVLVCELYILGGNAFESFSSRLEILNISEDEEESDTSEDEESDEEYEPTCSTPKNCFTLPIQCFAQTKVLQETKFVKTILDSLINVPNYKKAMVLHLPEDYPSLSINLQKNSDGNIDIQLHLTGRKIEQSLMVFCEANVFNDLGRLLHSFKNKHIFTVENGHQWITLTKSIKPTDFESKLCDLSSNKLNLKLGFEVSFGETFSKIINVAYMNVPRYFIVDGEYVVSDQMLRLYKEKKVCDVIIKVGNDAFDVHKVILAAASPVFTAMFGNEMAENKTNVVYIEDLDKETVDEMVSFLYTGSVKELEYKSARNLFIAGDKYQILPLLKLCRNAMISHMSEQNIYEILSIADTHSDIMLEKAAVKFMKLNKFSILSSSDWENFEKENLNFAVKILRQVCLLVKKNITLM